MFFASDNTSGVPGEVMAALARANEGYARSYGADEIMGRVTARLREVFEAPEAVVHLVATGTAANALALATMVPPPAAQAPANAPGVGGVPIAPGAAPSPAQPGGVPTIIPPTSVPPGGFSPSNGPPATAPSTGQPR